MTKIKITFSVLALISATAFTSCEKDDDTEPTTPTGATATRVNNIVADTGNTGNYTFFSLRTNSVIPSADSATTNWDVAFRSTSILVNSGTSGPGVGGAIVLTQAFSDVTEAPASGYAADNAPTSYAIPTGSGNGWYNYNFTTMLISPIAGKTLVLKTADGKYAKMEILSYYKDAPANPDTTSWARYYTFQYIYRSDGTRKLN
jgi:hypothetical protein